MSTEDDDVRCGSLNLCSASLSYLLNPFSILSCVAKSTCGLNNAVLALFVLATIKGDPQLSACRNVPCPTVFSCPFCVSGNVLLSAVFLCLATYQSIYPITLCAAAMLYFMQVRPWKLLGQV